MILFRQAEPESCTVQSFVDTYKGRFWPTAALLAQGNAKPPSTEVMT